MPEVFMVLPDGTEPGGSGRSVRAFGSGREVRVVRRGTYGAGTRAGPRGREPAGARGPAQLPAGITKLEPSLAPEGQRVVTVLVFV
ncbi:hypothetical protein GCM10007061_16900 [Kocuria marina]|nr:hypothetical protein GCM10007061_16900 [Kocuria marina]